MSANLLYIVNTFPRISETFVLNEILALTGSGYRVEVISLNRPVESLVHEKLQNAGISSRVHYVPRLNRNRFVKYLLGLKMIVLNAGKWHWVLNSLNFIKHGEHALNLTFLFFTSTFLRVSGYRDFTVIHCHFGDNLLFADYLVGAGIFKGKVFCTFHGIDVNRYLNKGIKGYYGPYNVLLEKAVVNSGFLKSRLVSCGIQEDKIVRLPVAVDVDLFRNDHKTYRRNGRLNIVSVGRLSEEKGFDTLIEAVRTLVHDKQRKDIRLSIVGDGSLKEQLMALAGKNGLTSYIDFQGFKTQHACRELLLHMDLMVLCSRRTLTSEETQGLVLQEAQAMGIPVIASDIGGISEGIVPGKSGLLCPENEVPAFADAIEYFYLNPDQLDIMGQHGRKLVNERFDMKDRNLALIRLLS